VTHNASAEGTKENTNHAVGSWRAENSPRRARLALPAREAPEEKGESAITDLGASAPVLV
jgi:hypothetical protein